jgi:hypothetical protein
MTSGAAGLVVSGLLLAGSPNILPPPIDWRRVGDNVEVTCSWVAAVEKLLHEMQASIDGNILRLIRVCLKKERKICPCASHFLQALSSPPVFVSVAPVLS